ncbi:MAG: DUF2490 domain-containing protein [Flavobacteriales bacterium]|nr:DUF2490 domain-containing protein [Flavobacteriales bacterium]
MNSKTSGQDFLDGFGSCFHCEPIPANDWGMIFQGTVSRKFNNKLKGEMNIQPRIMNKFKSLQTIMLEPGVKVKLSEHFALKSAFRYSLARYQDHRQRLHVAGYYVWHKEGVPLRIQYRMRVEAEGFFFWRNRIKIASNFRNVLKPYSSFEIFDQYNRIGFVNLYRYEGGIKWEMNEASNITLMYRLESNISLSYKSDKIQVLGLMLNYSIKPRAKTNSNSDGN